MTPALYPTTNGVHKGPRPLTDRGRALTCGTLE
jgi:hypothetical protein